MADEIRFQRGPQSRLPLLGNGEPAITTEGEFFIGTSSGNVQFAKKEDVNGLSARLSHSAIYLDKLPNELDYTQAFQRALDSMDSVLGGTIVIPQGKTIDFTTATITKQNVRIIGRGTLTGKLIINCSDTYNCNVSIEGVRFVTTGIAIEVKKGRRFHISNCVFQNCDKAIYINPDTEAPFHSISMGNIAHNEFIEVNYALYIDKQVGVADRFFQVNDFTFSDNHVAKAYVCHVYAKEIDGIVIKGNTFFFPSANDVQDQTKTYNIYIKNADWVIISDNNLFESGFESIYLDYVTHPNISNNNIAWCGQRQPSSGILVNYSGGTTLQAFIKIAGNNISKATKHGIELSGVSYGSIEGNVIECQLANYAYYYGVTDLSTLSHYGVFINSPDTTAALKFVLNNTVVNTTKANRSSYIHVSKVDITDTRTTLESEGMDIVNLVQPSATTITSMNNGFDGKTITLQAFNANTTLQYGLSTFLLKGGVNVTIPNTGIIVLRYNAGKWYEISRNF